MEKPYDLKALGQKIAEHAKADGLAIAEEALEKLGRAVYLGAKQWAQESAALTDTKVDDLAAKLYDFMDPFVLEQIQKIDLDRDGK